ncbi:MAG: AAA family ATPase [Bacillota bacterium]|nr:AAA family ATPase [Bacillota bacterium]
MFSTSDEGILRVKSINICDFRGIKKLNKPLNTDADVVLITGPNGFGKTSLIDALCLLLTGHLHPLRDPVIFELPEIKYFPEKATLEATILKTSGAEKNVTVTVPRKGSPVCSDPIWHRSPSAREITAKASFFYQDLVEETFDNFTRGTTLKDFLAPPPEEVEVARFALKEALKQVEQKEKMLVITGVESEAALNKEREEIARSVTTLWRQLIFAVENFNIVPRELPGIDVLKIGGNLKKDWQKKLADFTLSFGNYMSLEEPSEDMNITSTLINFQALINELKIKYILPKSDTAERLNHLIASLPDATNVLKLNQIDALKNDCLELEKELAKNKERLQLLLKVENHFKSPEGPGLLEIMQSLRHHGHEWQQLDVGSNDEYMRPPEEVMNWLNAAYTSLTVNGKPLDEILANWQEQVENERSRLSSAVNKQEKELSECMTTIDILEEIKKIANTSADAQELLKKAQERARQRAKLEAGQVFRDATSKSETHPVKLADDILKALDKWIDVEKRDQIRQEQLKKSGQYRQAKEQIRILKDALSREITRDKSVLESILQVPDSEAQKLAELINKILYRFRLVRGILPVRIQSSQRKQGRNQQGTWEFKTADGRTLTSLSTGQQSQLALSLLLGLNISLDISFLRHGIIALDDTTTSFDMAQLPREAALLRQIVYGTGDDDSPRRQLFIVSHHEELTHRLMDFLIPPQGKKMHILNFDDWSPEEGPKIEQYQMESAKPAREGRKDLGRFLRDVLKENFG